MRVSDSLRWGLQGGLGLRQLSLDSFLRSALGIQIRTLGFDLLGDVLQLLHHSWSEDRSPGSYQCGPVDRRSYWL